MNDETNYRGVVYPWQCDHAGHHARVGMRRRRFPAEPSYRREMFPGDLIEITTRLLEVGDRSIRFLHEMRNAVTGEATATCEMTAAHLDRRTRKSAPWPPEIRQAAMHRLGASEPASA